MAIAANGAARGIADVQVIFRGGKTGPVSCGLVYFRISCRALSGEGSSARPAPRPAIEPGWGTMPRQARFWI